MKIRKAIISIIIFALVFASAIPLEAFAELPVFSAMTDEELHDLINGARNELKTRELNAEADMILFEQDGITVYLTGEYETYGSDSTYVDLKVIVVNDSDKDVNIQVDSVTVNGWDVYGSGISGITAGHKKKGELGLKIDDADITTFEEIEEVEFNLYIYDSTAWERISTVDPITVHFN